MDVPIKGFKYHVINEAGEVTNLKTNNKIKPCLFKIGYFVYSINEDGHMYKRYLHRLLAEAFIPNPENKPQINHIDGNKQNNALDNLEWVTNKENCQHAVRTKLHTYTRVCDEETCKKIFEEFLQHIPFSKLTKKYNTSATQLSIFINQYVDANNLREQFDNEIKYQKKIRNKEHSKKMIKHIDLVMCDKNTFQELKHFNSLKEAREYLNVKSSGSISNALAGIQNFAYGYFWKYGDQTSTTIPQGSTFEAIASGSSEHPEKDEDIV